MGVIGGFGTHRAPLESATTLAQGNGESIAVDTRAHSEAVGVKIGGVEGLRKVRAAQMGDWSGVGSTHVGVQAVYNREGEAEGVV